MNARAMGFRARDVIGSILLGLLPTGAIAILVTQLSGSGSFEIGLVVAAWLLGAIGMQLMKRTRSRVSPRAQLLLVLVVSVAATGLAHSSPRLGLVGFAFISGVVASGIVYTLQRMWSVNGLDL